MATNIYLEYPKRLVLLDTCDLNGSYKRIYPVHKESEEKPSSIRIILRTLENKRF